MPREMMENERATAITPGEAVEEKVSLSDRFGLWIGFHNCSQADSLDMVTGLRRALRAEVSRQSRLRAWRRWNGRMTRGSRSGRVAWQYIQDLAGRLGKPL